MRESKAFLGFTLKKPIGKFRKIEIESTAMEFYVGKVAKLYAVNSFKRASSQLLPLKGCFWRMIKEVVAAQLASSFG